ncbi:MAG: DUF3187 family protein [Gammaproteobacteria bacterium]|nr:MAG: DUF3187 family protein [Gammaproteobacteria bacterium]
MALLSMAILMAITSGSVHSKEPEASGFVMRNHGPFTALVGIPARWPDGTDHAAEFVWNVSNHAMHASGTDVEILQDGETHTLTARFQYPVSPRVRAGVELPWISHSGGSLDSLIDTWHGWFGLPEGIRPQLADDQLDYVIRLNGVDTFRMNESVSGIGDIRLALAVELGKLEKWLGGGGALAGYLSRVPWRMSLTAKLPTGEAEKLTGSGSADIAAGVGWRSPHARGAAVNWWLDLGLVWPGKVDLAAFNVAGQIFYYDAALTWRVVRRFDVIVQVAGHSGVYQGDIATLARPAAQLAVGGLWHITPGIGIRAGIFEDLRAKSAPDFGIELAVIIGRWK